MTDLWKRKRKNSISISTNISVKENLRNVSVLMLDYWKYLKGKMAKDGVELVSVTHDFKFQADSMP